MQTRTGPLRTALALPAAVLAVLALVAAVAWADLDAGGRLAMAGVFTPARFAMVLLLLVPALAGLGWFAARSRARSNAIVARLTESTRLIAHVNPAHRVTAA